MSFVRKLFSVSFVLLLSHLELTKNEQLLILKCLCISFGCEKIDIFPVKWTEFFRKQSFPFNIFDFWHFYLIKLFYYYSFLLNSFPLSISISKIDPFYIKCVIQAFFISPGLATTLTFIGKLKKKIKIFLPVPCCSDFKSINFESCNLILGNIILETNKLHTQSNWLQISSKNFKF